MYLNLEPYHDTLTYYSPSFSSRTVVITGALQPGWRTTSTILSTPRPVSADHCNSHFNPVALHLNPFFFFFLQHIHRLRATAGEHRTLRFLGKFEICVRLSKGNLQTLNTAVLPPLCLNNNHLIMSLFPQFCQVGNFSIHVALRNLKLPGERFPTMHMVFLVFIEEKKSS